MQQPLFPELNQPVKPSLAEQLNAPQLEAVTTTEGAVLVIAGAGSGKTRTLVYRVAHLIKNGVNPARILLLTFTRKSAQEMLYRASIILDDSCNQVVGGTFHAVASNLLRRYGHHLGYSPQFTILDRADSEGIVNLLKSSLDLSGVGKKFPSKRLVINIFSQIVNKQTSLSELISLRYHHLDEYRQDLELIYEHYGKFKREHNLMDYDDLLVNFHKVITIPEVGAEIAARYSHIMVDEYQDTNHIQAAIIRLLAAPHNNIMVVGDDSQSIYSFRGADFKNIMDFPQIFKDVKLIRLEENYRSTQPILSMTNAIIERAAEKYTKKLFTSVEGGEKPVIYSARNDGDQATFIGREIEKLQKKGVGLGQIAVLFRSGFHSYKLELELGRRQLLFEKRGGLKLTESAHIKDVVSYLRVIYNPQDNLSWNRILLLLEKVGPKTAQSILNVIKLSPEPVKALAKYPAGKSWKRGLRDLAVTIDDLMNCYSPLEQFERLMAYYQDIFERIYHDDYPNRSRDLEQLKEIIGGYKSLEDFIKDTALDPPELDSAANQGGEDEKMILSTVHSAKGLEWDTVFVIHLVEGKFPSGMAQTAQEIEEERRLLYVAATRAKKRLFLVYPREIVQAGRLREPSIISRFLEEIPHGLASMSESSFDFGTGASFSFASEKISKSPSPKVKTQLAGMSDEIGQQVRHPFFGEGRIVNKIGPSTVQVMFNRHGQKTINLDYVKMEILG